MCDSCRPPSFSRQRTWQVPHELHLEQDVWCDLDVNPTPTPFSGKARQALEEKQGLLL